MAVELQKRDLFQVKVLFVCMDDFCRSSIAQVIFEKKIAQSGLSFYVYSDSAGINNFCSGQKPDSLSQHAVAFRGYSLIGQEARQIIVEDFNVFDMILAMDWYSLRKLKHISPIQQRYKIELVMRYAQNLDAAEVPDPYYQEQHAFNIVVDYLEDAICGLLDAVKCRIRQ